MIVMLEEMMSWKIIILQGAQLTDIRISHKMLKRLIPTLELISNRIFFR